MKQKIEWYREVLELEPGSRVFFPLARLLASDKQLKEAILTLKQGLLRHPDHMEARLFLVELLVLENPASSDLKNEVELLGTIFGTYPGFWKAWSASLAVNPVMHDAALALRFFASAIQGKPVSWAAIIESGLQALVAGLETTTTPALTDIGNTNIDVALYSKETNQYFSIPTSKVNPTNVNQTLSITLTPVKKEQVNSKDNVASPIAMDSATKQDASLFDNDTDDDDGDEAFSLRTRSMAEVLAEQGDIAGALDIYKELIGLAEGEERHSLELRAEELSRKVVSGVSTEHNQAIDAGTDNKEGSRLIGILESLAERLEARAH